MFSRSMGVLATVAASGVVAVVVGMPSPAASAAVHHGRPASAPAAALPVSIGTAVAFVRGPGGAVVTVPPTSFPGGSEQR